MPKTRSLTKAQREAEQIERICKVLLDRLNETQGRQRKTDAEFSRSIGISRATWHKWNHGGLSESHLGKVITAVIRTNIVTGWSEINKHILQEPT